MPWNDPLLPKGAIAPAQEMLDQRYLDQSPNMARLRGFGAGALEGLRDLTTPTSLASLLPMGKAFGAGAKALSFAPKLARAAGPTMQILEDATPIAQAMPTAREAVSAIGSMGRNLAQVPQAGQRAQVLANLPNEFKPPVSGLKQAMDPYAEEMVKKYIGRGAGAGPAMPSSSEYAGEMFRKNVAKGY